MNKIEEMIDFSQYQMLGAWKGKDKGFPFNDSHDGRSKAIVLVLNVRSYSSFRR